MKVPLNLVVSWRLGYLLNLNYLIYIHLTLNFCGFSDTPKSNADGFQRLPSGIGNNFKFSFYKMNGITKLRKM